MVTLCLDDISNVVDFETRKRAEPSARARENAIRDAVTDYCKSLGFGGPQIGECIDAAMAEKAFGASNAVAVEAGRKCANRIANNQRILRTRCGTRPDSNGSSAA